jgi:hypothetical protein
MTHASEVEVHAASAPSAAASCVLVHACDNAEKAVVLTRMHACMPLTSRRAPALGAVVDGDAHLAARAGTEVRAPAAAAAACGRRLPNAIRAPCHAPHAAVVAKEAAQLRRRAVRPRVARSRLLGV